MKIITLISIIIGISLNGLADEMKKEKKIVKHTAKEFTINKPTKWRTINIGGNFLLYLNGDGIHLPITDNGAPLQTGLTIQRFEGVTGSIDEGAKHLVEASKKDPQFKPTGESAVTKLKLPDGNNAVLVVTQGIKNGTRSSLQIKLTTKAKGDIGFIASAFLVGGPDSKIAIATSPEAQVLIECLTSLQVTNPEQKNSEQGVAPNP